MKAVSLVATALATLLSAPIAFGSEPNPVTEKFTDGCLLATQSTDALRDASSERKTYAVMCVTAANSSLQIAKSASRFKYLGVDVCVPPSASTTQLMHRIVSASAIETAKQQNPADLVVLALVDLYRCDG